MSLTNHQRYLRVLELYSGIGGMHYALEASGLPFEVAMAVDINTTANSIYRHNFPSTDLHSFGIEKLSVKRYIELNVNAILMSPPCQPFTRVGKKRDCDDIRTKSFLHILQLLRQLDKNQRPRYLLLENVKGFEDSLTHSQFVSCLRDCGYHYQQFLLTPLQFGIPNCRLRFYLIARLECTFHSSEEDMILTDLHAADPSVTHYSPNTIQTTSPGPQFPEKLSGTQADTVHSDNASDCSWDVVNDHAGQIQPPQPKRQCCHTSNVLNASNNCSSARVDVDCSGKNENIVEAGSSGYRGTPTPEDNGELRQAGRNMRYCEEEDPYIDADCKPLADFMEEKGDFEQFVVPDKNLYLFVVMDVVFPALKKSTCFTKRYGHYIEGAGSVVQMTKDVQAVKLASEFKTKAVAMKNRSEWGEKELQILRNLKLRYFTPKEVANLLCFPPHFGYPKCLSSLQLYRVLGNSLNVHVVAQLIRVMVASRQTDGGTTRTQENNS